MHSIKTTVSELSRVSRSSHTHIADQKSIRHDVTKTARQSARLDKSIVLIRMCHLGGQVQKRRICGIHKGIVDIRRNEGLIDGLPQDSSIPRDAIRICQNVMQSTTQSLIHITIQHLYPKLHGLARHSKDRTRSEGGVTDICGHEHAGQMLGVEERAADVESVLAQPDERDGEMVRSGDCGARL